MNKIARYAASAVLLASMAAGAVAFAASVGIAVPYVSSIVVTDAVQVIKGAVPSAQNTYASGLQLRNFVFGLNSQLGTTAPTLTSCGTGSPAVTGTNTAGTVTAGTSATGCIITFATAYVTAPVCVVSSEVAPGTSTPAYSVTASAITLVQASQSGNKWDYICVAQPGG